MGALLPRDGRELRLSAILVLYACWWTCAALWAASAIGRAAMEL
ncbi:MAG: hypothetical protein ACOZNI_24655 [Myxococcota bacterium]